MRAEEELVERQLAAYNAHDLKAFLECYSDAVSVFRMPSREPSIRGKGRFADFYRTQRFCLSGLRAEVLKRISVGNKIIDHERVHGLEDEPVELVAVYEIDGELIEQVWFFYPD